MEELMDISRVEAKYIFRRIKGLIDDEDLVMRDPHANALAIMMEEALTVYASLESRVKYFRTKLNDKYIEEYERQDHRLQTGRQINTVAGKSARTLTTLCKILRGMNQAHHERET